MAQPLGAAAVAPLATEPALIFPASVELDVVELVLACFIAFVGYAVSRSSGANRVRSFVYGATLLIVAGVVVVVKIALGAIDSTGTEGPAGWVGYGQRLVRSR